MLSNGFFENLSRTPAGLLQWLVSCKSFRWLDSHLCAGYLAVWHLFVKDLKAIKELR